MTYYKMSDYSLVKYQKSNTKGKKYDAVIRNRKTGRTITISFGASDYEHYKDSTGKGLWSHKDHGDSKRRKSYRARHKVYLRDGYYSAGWFSYYKLW